MQLDIRIPIGLMFGTFGVILAGFGFFSDRAIYQRSLGFNVNLSWGLFLLGFSALMLGMAYRASRRRKSS